MKNITIYLLIIMLFGCQNSSTNSDKTVRINANTQETESADYGETFCIYQKSDKKLDATHPFDKADRIEIVSYPEREDNYLNDSLIVNEDFIVK
jgi:uncharacterized lipoprotein NlpE involved in copper resistance